VRCVLVVPKAITPIIAGIINAISNGSTTPDDIAPAQTGRSTTSASKNMAPAISPQRSQVVTAVMHPEHDRQGHVEGHREHGKLRVLTPGGVEPAPE
jgi:hypothetical protein